MIEPKTYKMKFLGEDVIFTERTANDFFSIQDMSGEKWFTNLSEAKKEVFTSAALIRDFARPYIDGLHGIIPKWRIRRKFQTKNIIKSMSPVQIIKTAALLLKEIEGYDPNENINLEKKKDRNLSS